MASFSSSSIFDTTSPFVEYCTTTTRGTLMSVLRLVAHTYHATPAEAVNAYLDGTNVAQKTIGFKQLLNDYFQQCCDEYMITHQQIVDGTKQLSSLNENNLDEYVYCVMQKMMSQNNGYKHINYIFDGAMVVCVIQFKYILTSLPNGLQIGCSNSSRGGLFHDAEQSPAGYPYPTLPYPTLQGRVGLGYENRRVG